MNNWTWLDSFSLVEVAALPLLSLILTAICSYVPNKLLRHTEKNGANFSKTACIIFISCLFCNGTGAGPLIYYVNSELKSGQYLTIHSNIWAVFIFLFFSPHTQDFSYLNQNKIFGGPIYEIYIYLKIQDKEFAYGYFNSSNPPMHTVCWVSGMDTCSDMESKFLLY